MTSTTPPEHRIVVGVNDSDSSRYALHWAAQQAEMTGFSLEVVMAWEWPLSLGRGMPLLVDYDPATDAANRLDQVLDEVIRVHPGLDIHPKIVEGLLVPVLIEASKGADLAVIGAGHHCLKGAPLGAHYLTRVHCPVVIVREDQDTLKGKPPANDTSLASGRTTTALAM